MELTGLSSDTEYEVRLRAMNSQGWSQLSNPFQFRTAGENFRRKKPTQITNKKIARDGASYPIHSSSEQQVRISVEKIYTNNK
jgi:hypothetical protein